MPFGHKLVIPENGLNTLSFHFMNKVLTRLLSSVTVRKYYIHTYKYNDIHLNDNVVLYRSITFSRSYLLHYQLIGFAKVNIMNSGVEIFYYFSIMLFLESFFK